jgi:hypothetical protein
MVLLVFTLPVFAQQHQMEMPRTEESAPAWMFMQDGVLFAVFNHQAGPRGGDEFKVLNWWMGMASRKVRRDEDLTFTAMFSLDPATVGTRGYRELFQAGEAIDGQPLIDRQHPHDLFMQLAGIWRIPVGDTTGFTIAAGPVGEPALGPVAFMHRPSAAENPMAPLEHHLLDSTHVAFGVATVAVDRGPITVEASVFNGREPDQNRWDFDFGRLDSVSARLWYKPTPQWELQVSTGHLVHPEQLEPGNIERTTASATWLREQDEDLTAIAFAYGVNASDHGTRHGVLVEATRRVGKTTTFGRVEARQLEPSITPVSASVGALTIGATRDILKIRGLEGALGGDVTMDAVPSALRAAYGAHPVSIAVFFRLRPPTGLMGRMWNMRMSQPPRM